ncbi:MAG: hypothetical protein CMJ46_07265 [Planctomyces sp.]|nr:hypothetical protein [Planctomyces sp.]
MGHAIQPEVNGIRDTELKGLALKQLCPLRTSLPFEDMVGSVVSPSRRSRVQPESDSSNTHVTTG